LPFKIQQDEGKNPKGKFETKKDEWLIFEKYLEGEWTKWNANNGYVNQSKLSVHAYCHWTYHTSNGDLVMCDMQGVRDTDKYTITDPCICSVEQE